MTFRIAKSEAEALGFEKAVADHIAALEAHRFEGGEAPSATNFVERSVKRVQYPIEDGRPDDFVADYEIYDDTPLPPSLEEQKQQQRSASRMQELQEIDALMPPGKRRLLEMRAQDAFAVEEQERTVEQATLISDFLSLQAAIRAVNFAAAEREAAIDDLGDSRARPVSTVQA